MKTLAKIMVFGNDKNLLVLLQGYCFAKEVKLIARDFKESSIRDMAKINPGLVIIPINLLRNAQNTTETKLLKQEVRNSNQLKACLLNDGTNKPIPKDLSTWIDVVTQEPVDLLKELDSYVDETLAEYNDVAERRRKERRNYHDRRAVSLNKFNGQDIAPFKNHLDNSQIGNIEVSESSCYGFQLDRRQRCLLINGNKIDLTPKEFELIELLLTDSDRIFMTDEIIQHLWPENHRATKSDLYQYMHLLRKKVEEDPNHPKWLMNVKGYGYKLNLN